MLLVLDESFTPPAPGIARAYPVTWRTMRFVLTHAPDYAVSSSGPGDALNPSSWTVENLATSTYLTTISVKQVDAVTFDVNTIETLPSSLIGVGAGISGLYFSGAAVSSTEAVKGMNWAAVNTNAGISAQKRQVTTDLANPPTSQGQNTSGVGGTLQIAGGDYINDIGDAFVKKMIYRLLVTPPGGFFHLPNWGLGILNPKALIKPSQLLAAKASIEQIISSNVPEVSQVQAQLKLTAGGILYIIVNAKTQPQGSAIQVSANSGQVLPGGN